MSLNRRGLTLEVVSGITEHANRVALKGVFQSFGDVLSCWIPPIDRRHCDYASVRFASSEQADAAKKACDGGQVYFQGVPLKVEFQTGSGPRVGNSDIGGGGRRGDGPPDMGGARALALQNGGRSRSRERDRRRRSRSRDRRRSRSRERRRSMLDDIERPKLESSMLLPAPQLPSVPATPPAPQGLTAAQQYYLMNGSTVGGVATPIPMSADAAMAAAGFPAASMPPAGMEAEDKRRKDIAAARAAQTKRGPGVAALVQGALKRAQSAATVKEKKDDVDEAKPAKRKDGRKDAEDDVDNVDDVAPVPLAPAEPVLSPAERQRQAAERARQEAAERARREYEEQVRREREAAEALELEREKARRAAEEAEREREQAEKEAATRGARVRAGVEAAKRKQAERERQQGGMDGTLYSDMPQPLPADEAALKEEEQRKLREAQRRRDLALPPEDRGKVIFLDVDGVLRPARAGGFDTLTVDGKTADTSDFFPSAMQALRHIVERTGAIIVLSSEWRRNEALRKAVDDVLETHRLRPCHATTRMDEMQLAKEGSDPVRQFAERRAREIAQYLQEHEDEVKGWVVLDDINLAIADEDKKSGSKGIGPKLVQTWPLCGLTMGNAKTAVRILNGAFIHKVLVERPRAPGGVGPGLPPAPGIGAVPRQPNAAR